MKPNDLIVLELDNGDLYLSIVDDIVDDMIYINGFDEGFTDGVYRAGIDEHEQDVYFRIHEFTGAMKDGIEHDMKIRMLQKHALTTERKLNQVYDLIFGNPYE